VVLLVSSGLLSKSLRNLQEVDPGIGVSGLLIMPISLTGPRYFGGDTGNEGYAPFFRDVVQRISTIPGVASASWVPDPPIYGRNMTTTVRTEETIEDETSPSVGFHTVGPDYFETMGIPLIAGRGITRADDEGAVPIAVVDEVFAEQMWPSERALGKRIYAWSTWYTIVGVAGRIHHGGLRRDAEPEVYVSGLQTPIAFNRQRIVIRSLAPLGTLAPQLREAVWEVDPTVPVPSIDTMEDRVSVVLREPRFHVVLMGSFSFTALVLTLAGIYGLMSYWVTTRTREVGLRMALGARGSQVLWAVSRNSLFLISVGLAVGLGLAAASSRLLEAILFAVSTLDLPTFAMVAGGVGAIALLACLVPAARATRTDPTKALRCE
jgi:putative ABC transport system permease protein